MRHATCHRHVLAAAALTAAALLAAPGPAAAAPAPSSLRPVATLSAERLATADLVAAAKWGTDSPVDDPAREQQVLDAVAAQAEQIGADPDEARRIFRDQIEANKIVQRGLHRWWSVHPEQAPTTKPDLNVVRQKINRINTELVQALAVSTPQRAAPSCRPELALAVLQVHHDTHPDPLHTVALARSLTSVCES
ncbi:chorismate mutase [Streptomyces sp. HUCO-GS316]|uniref:chorismate mutase n=1 Tax=Streptomyces sp. HUCO-GS316 TaxID=2692198 RepID=UPI00136DEC7F|nr:chorismate mutase [Streptomyces sp. HUCO-GS316]MXM67013.1 chorismate mutase [Streptomyces sp. HUCO-GS316]